MLLRLVGEKIFRMHEADLRDAQSDGEVGVYYSSTNYQHSLEHVLQLRQEILKDFPNMKDSEMEVMEVRSKNNTGHTALYIRIPIDEYLKLRNAGKISIK